MARKSDFERDRGCLYSGRGGIERCGCGEESFHYSVKVILTAVDGLRLEHKWFCRKCYESKFS